MATATQRVLSNSNATVQLATFYVADMCLALEIAQIQEIIRFDKITRVPHAPPTISGVINLRGEVTTVVDLRQVLGLPPSEVTSDNQTLIVRSQGESIGLLVDSVGNIWDVDASSIMPSPPNVNRVDGRFFRGVYPRESEVVVVLDLEQALAQ